MKRRMLGTFGWQISPFRTLVKIKYFVVCEKQTIVDSLDGWRRRDTAGCNANNNRISRQQCAYLEANSWAERTELPLPLSANVAANLHRMHEI